MENKKLTGFMYELKLRGLSSKTLTAYYFANDRFLKFIRKEPIYVTTRDIKVYINHLIDTGKKPKTINLMIAALKSYYDDYLGRRLFNKINRVKNEKHIPNVLSTQELNAMINNTKNEKHKLIIKLLYASGVRVGELVKLKVADLDLDNGFIRVMYGKGKKDRLTVMSKMLCRELFEYLKYRPHNYYLFQNSKESHLTTRAVQEIVKTSAIRSGIKRRVYPHALRASFATHLYDRGTQLQKIQKLMGHADDRTTKGYTKSAVIDIKDVISPLDNLEIIAGKCP
ncbi:MAG: tyrosine-type recombinase/integrase [Nanoarchaeota archaeon]|nr:tyrosine-type recombinase/integrase [Nanoarchaeota archaeon]MBU1704510.1 tyrosine-type recombinase/integrase [Nanoarchaeota archaeon]